MNCNDKAKDLFDSGAKEPAVRALMDRCVSSCVDEHLNLLPSMMRRLKDSLNSIPQWSSDYGRGCRISFSWTRWFTRKICFRECCSLLSPHCEFLVSGMCWLLSVNVCGFCTDNKCDEINLLSAECDPGKKKLVLKIENSFFRTIKIFCIVK